MTRKIPFRRANAQPGAPRGSKNLRGLDFDDVIYGIHAVEEALTAGEKLRAIYVTDDRKRDPLFRKILDQAKAVNIPIHFEQRSWFTQLPYKVHQGLVAIAPPFEYAGLHGVLSARDSSKAMLVIVLDHITDPHNLGAIIRTAECAGAAAIVLPERRAAGVNPTVRKTSAGAAEHIPIVRVGNLADAIRQLKKANIWVAGADAAEGAKLMTEADLAGDIALVIGAEGEGLAPLIRRECDFLVKIPLFGKVASLNASVAAAILIYEAIRQRKIT